ncbi:MAG TPA: DUF1269 domain-containing protein [Thermomicrobiales bacterium]|nr:DUF1269 domain-containing protein [Thermomicrobiales bacterium]
MAMLFAITYPDPNQAEQAMGSVDWSHFDHLIRVKSACWISKEDGELAVHPWGHPVAGKATGAGALGLLVGGLFGLPVLGVAAGALVGARKAKQHEVGIDDDFLLSIEDHLGAGGSAVVVLFEEGADTARAAASLAQYGGTVHSTDIPADVLARFQARLDRA